MYVDTQNVLLIWDMKIKLINSQIYVYSKELNYCFFLLKFILRQSHTFTYFMCWFTYTI